MSEATDEFLIFIRRPDGVRIYEDPDTGRRVFTSGGDVQRALIEARSQYPRDTVEHLYCGPKERQS